MASRSGRKASDMKMKKTKEHLYNAQGAPEAGEAMDETPGFKKGGHAKKHGKHHKHKDGGHVDGHHAKHRADKHARGGKAHKRASGGRTPYSSGHNPAEPSESKKTNMGHEGERPSSGA